MQTNFLASISITNLNYVLFILKKNFFAKQQKFFYKDEKGLEKLKSSCTWKGFMYNKPLLIPNQVAQANILKQNYLCNEFLYQICLFFIYITYMKYIYFQNLSIIQNYFQLVKNLHKSALMFKVENFLLDNKSVRTRWKLVIMFTFITHFDDA